MASGWYNLALKKLADHSLDLTGTLKVMLVNSAYTYNPDDDYVDMGGSDPKAAELSGVSGYTRGYGGAGRKTPSLTFTEQDASNRAVIKIADLTWTALGTGDTIVAAVLVKEGTVNDTDSLLIAYLAVTSTPTNGSDITLSMDATNGNLRLTS